MTASNELLLQDSCLYTTPAYLATVWGKYIWHYQGQGRLRLTAHALVLEDKLQLLRIHHAAITRIDTGVFSRWGNPFGLAYIRLHFMDAETERELILVPVKSLYAFIWDTNKVIENWMQHFDQIDALSKRLVRPLQLPEPPTPFQLGVYFGSLLLLWLAVASICPLMVYFLRHGF